MTEIWRDIEGYEGFYQVSNLGRVKSLDVVITNGCGTFVKKGQIRKQNIRTIYNSTKYSQVTLFKNNKGTNNYAHKLVAQAFPEICGEWFEGCEVHHIDYDGTNNVAENLVVLSKEEHYKLHANSEVTKERLHKSHIGQKSWNKGKHSKSGMEGKRHTEESKNKMKENSTLKKTVYQYSLDGELIRTFESTMDAQREYGYDNANISACCRGKIKTAYGYKWRYDS